MAKDPAVLFYTSDFLVGTALMDDAEIGRYIKILCLQHQKGRLTEKQFFGIARKEDVDLIEKFLIDDCGFYYNERMEIEAEKRRKFTESRRNSRLKSDEDKVRVYLMKDRDTGYIKIGSSVNPLRRLAEMRNQSKPAKTVGNRDYYLLYVTCIVKRSVESELHKKFSSKRIKGEWFDLSDGDIEYVIRTYVNTDDRTYEVTYVERTENENEIINEDINSNANSEKTNKPKKHKHGEYKHVLLTEAEYQRLLSEWGKEKLSSMISKLDEGIQLKGYKYKDHNLALRKWEKKEPQEKPKYIPVAERLDKIMPIGGWKDDPK
ncbi:MAG: GIY-YIG nuclease family protein [Gammaproteobacteria bacterium]|jgi:hypothetical protein